MIQNLALGLCLLFATAVPVFAADVGDAMEAFTLEDQYGNEHTLNTSIQRIYANAGRDADKLMKAALKDNGQAQLDAQNAIAVAEISGAPGFVKRIIRSSLKDRSYLTWTDTRGNTKKILPYRGESIALVELDQLKITAIRYLNSEDDLRAALAETITRASAPAISDTHSAPTANAPSETAENTAPTDDK